VASGTGSTAASNAISIWRAAVGAGTLSEDRMSLAQIETFVTIAETRNVSRAAERLHVAQPALSRKLRSLEDELGHALFVRTPRGMELSPAGARFLEHARRILEAVSAAKDALSRSGTPTA
jgi:DNA-binding transcriptional LysR family regulator